jgi:hypothetical protein
MLTHSLTNFLLHPFDFVSFLTSILLLENDVAAHVLEYDVPKAYVSADAAVPEADDDAAVMEDATTADDVAAVPEDDAATAAADAPVLEDEEDNLGVFDLNLPLDEFGTIDFDFVENITGKLNYSFLLTKY